MITIIGGGNVASHLNIALKDKTETVLVNPRTFEGMPESPNLIIIAVADKAIEEVAKRINKTEAFVFHTSGSTPINILQDVGPNIGVFYPLQTFTRNFDLKYEEIPIFIEASNKQTKEKLQQLASLVSPHIYEADSQKRKQLHLASVFACNFTNALAGIADKLLNDTGFDFSVLYPLMKATVRKLDKLSPREAQTGPAVRGDMEVIAMHLEMLEKYHPNLKNIYNLFTDYIRQQNEV